MLYGQIIYSTKDKLPEFGKFVVCHSNLDNWICSTDEKGVYWKVARRLPIKIHDNHKVPYYWENWGPGMFFGHEVDMWFELPSL